MCSISGTYCIDFTWVPSNGHVGSAHWHHVPLVYSLLISHNYEKSVCCMGQLTNSVVMFHNHVLLSEGIRWFDQNHLSKCDVIYIHIMCIFYAVKPHPTNWCSLYLAALMCSLGLGASVGKNMCAIYSML